MTDINKYESELVFVQLREKFPEHPITIIAEPIDLHGYVSKHIIDYQLIFRGCVFTYPFELTELLKAGGIDLAFEISYEYCLFEDIVNIQRVELEFQLSMSDVCFNSRVNIINAHFKMVFILKRAIFKNNFLILGAIFDSAAGLDTISANRIEIARSDFSKELNCLAFEDVNMLRMEGTNVQRLNFHTFSKTNVNLIDISISEFFRCYDLTLREMNMNGMAIRNGYLLVEKLNVERANRETCRLIKHEAYRANNQILAMDYKVREMNEYRKEVYKWKTIYTWLLLTLNKWSNNYGKSWIRGFCFTIICWLVFFVGFVVLRDIVGNHPLLSVTEYIKESVNYLWLLNGLSGLLDDGVYTSWRLALLLVVFFVFGKILIGYGIYQTISAFRRFGK